ncbi:hypothetical protein FBULB1_8090 [Fusarium bulbicola]|nr:hypothetical protein FBULB1_8090 [Fusarium bulbicola]
MVKSLGLSQWLTQTGERFETDRRIKRYKTLYCICSTAPKLEIRFIPNKLNSTPACIAYFQAATLRSIRLLLLDLVRAIRRAGASFNAIRSELEIANVARVQGWVLGGIEVYVHRFVQNEVAAVGGTQDGRLHFFYAWHPDSDY